MGRVTFCLLPSFVGAVVPEKGDVGAIPVTYRGR